MELKPRTIIVVHPIRQALAQIQATGKRLTLFPRSGPAWTFCTSFSYPQLPLFCNPGVVFNPQRCNDIVSCRGPIANTCNSSFSQWIAETSLTLPLQIPAGNPTYTSRSFRFGPISFHVFGIEGTAPMCLALEQRVEI